MVGQGDRVMKYTDRYLEGIEKASRCIPNADMLRGKTVLVTGSTGMICSSVIDILLSMNRRENAGIRILAAGRREESLYKRFESFSESDGLFFVRYDATSFEPFMCSEHCDYIIHGASNANPGIYLKEPVETILANIQGLNVMLKFAASQGAEKLLYISSSEVYGKKESADPYSENDYGFLDILNERAGYPSAKRTGESLCVAYGMEYGVHTVMVRPGHIYGPSIRPSDNRASAEFTREAVKGENIVMKSRGEQLRSYCYTLDCASAILSVLLNGEPSAAYNISNPDSVCSIRDIAEKIAEKAGVSVTFDIPTEDEKKSYNLMDNSSLTADRLLGLGWRPAFSLDEGVENTIEVLRAGS